MWYNSTSGTNKAFVQIKAWSSGGNLGTSRYDIGGTGTQTAALGAGGYGGSLKNSTEEYGGSSWLTGGNMGTARYGVGMAGTQTAGLAFGGFTTGPSDLTEEYDGSSWTAGGALNNSRRNVRGCGLQTAALACGGSVPGPSGGSSGGLTEEYDGSSWTNQNVMSEGREWLSSFGIQTAAIAAGGTQGADTGSKFVESYDGTNWTTVNSLNDTKYGLAAGGVQTVGVVFGGNSPNTGTEEWDGNTWTVSPATLSSGRTQLGGAGTQSAALGFGGRPPPSSGTTATEEYNSTLQAGTRAAFSAGGTLNTGRGGVGGAGIQTAALCFAGATFPPLTRRNETEE